MSLAAQQQRAPMDDGQQRKRAITTLGGLDFWGRGSDNSITAIKNSSIVKMGHTPAACWRPQRETNDVLVLARRNGVLIIETGAVEPNSASCRIYNAGLKLQTLPIMIHWTALFPRALKIPRRCAHIHNAHKTTALFPHSHPSPAPVVSCTWQLSVAWQGEKTNTRRGGATLACDN